MLQRTKSVQTGKLFANARRGLQFKRNKQRAKYTFLCLCRAISTGRFKAM